MAIRLDFFKNSISSLLNRNPGIRNADLSGVLAANIVDFKGHIRISDAQHIFHSDGYEGVRKPAKIIYLSPYSFWIDLLVSIKRVFAGVMFLPSAARPDLRADLQAGRRITVFCALDGSDAEVLMEVDQKSLLQRILNIVFSRLFNT